MLLSSYICMLFKCILLPCMVTMFTEEARDATGRFELRKWGRFSAISAHQHQRVYSCMRYLIYLVFGYKSDIKVIWFTKGSAFPPPLPQARNINHIFFERSKVDWFSFPTSVSSLNWINFKISPLSSYGTGHSFLFLSKWFACRPLVWLHNIELNVFFFYRNIMSMEDNPVKSIAVQSYDQAVAPSWKIGDPL